MKVVMFIALIIACRIAIFLSQILFRRASVNIAGIVRIRKYLVDLGLSFVKYVAPQLFICVFAVLASKPGIAKGTIVGYAVAVPGFLLAFIAIVKTYKIKRSFIKFEIVIIILLTLLFEVLSLNNVFGLYDTITFFIFFAFFSVLTILKKKSPVKHDRKYNKNLTLHFILNFLLMLTAFSVLVASAYFIVYSSVYLCNALNLDFKVFGLIVIPLILLIPHLISGLKQNKENNNISDFVENILQSVVHTLLLVTSVITVIKPLAFGKAFAIVHTPFMIVLFIMFTIILLPRLKVTRIRSSALFFIYLAFIALTVIKIV